MHKNYGNSLGHVFYTHQYDFKENPYYDLRDSAGRFASVKNLKCPKCGRKETKDGHDPCIANLPGVINACCGHGTDEGYIQFENGITIRGVFEVEK